MGHSCLPCLLGLVAVVAVMSFLRRIPGETEEGQRASALAEKLGTEIPDDIHQVLWSLPIIEVLVKRIEALEAKAND
jgi:hypothetical protein